jgi:geranylgeranyl diphosphate synthase type I
MESSANRFFEQYREIITERLIDILEKKTPEVQMHGWGEDLLVRLRKFTLQGKMIRGGLTVLSYLLFREDAPASMLDMAAAVEIVHSSLLIHDDIMDRDTIRRGKPSIYHQYRTLARKRAFDDPDHFGESLGICAGDVGFFLAFEVVASLDLKPGIHKILMSRWASEFISVGLAQMQDVSLSTTTGGVSEDDILNLYRYKTARYTFSLPMSIGALAADAGGAVVAQLEKIGELMGIAFQLKDDELDLFGKEKVTGKPVGTDMQEGKKTLYWLYLMRLLEEDGALKNEDRDRLACALSGGKVEKDALVWIGQLTEERGIRTHIESMMRDLNGRAEDLIEDLRVRQEHRDILLSVARYNLQRDR